MEKKKMGLWHHHGLSGGKYLVLRRDGTKPEWPSFVLGARDPVAPVALRAYADMAERQEKEKEYVREVRELAKEFDAYRKSHGDGDPDGAPHRADDPATIAILSDSFSALEPEGDVWLLSFGRAKDRQISTLKFSSKEEAQQAYQFARKGWSVCYLFFVPRNSSRAISQDKKK